MKAWSGDLPVGKLEDLQAMFSSLTGRGEFSFHIRILGPSEVCAVSWASLPFYLDSGSERSVCRFLILYCQAQPKCILVQFIST